MSQYQTDYSLSFFGQSKMGTHARSIDWASHPLGPVQAWAVELKTAINIILGSKFPMFISWGKERHFFYNDAYALILGQKHPKAFGDEFYNIWSEIWHDIEPLILSVDRGEAVYLEDLKLVMNRHGCDEETYFTFSYSPILSNTGETMGLYCAVVETTERKLMEVALKAEQLKLMTVFSQAPNPIALLEGPEHTFAFANDAYKNEFLQGNNPRGKTVIDVLPEAKVQGFMDILDNVYGTGERYVGTEAEFYIEDRNGTKKQFFFNFVYEPIRNAQGDVEAILAVVSDVTGLVQSRNVAQASELRLHTLAETVPQIAWRTDALGFATYFNQNFLKKTGRTLEESLHDKWIEVIHPDDHALTLERWQKAVEEKSDYVTEYRVRMADGTYRWHLSRAVPVRDQDGTILEWVGAATDIEDQKHELCLRDEFLSIASHELKTPLTSLKLQGQFQQRLLKRNDPIVYSPANVQESIQQTNKQITRLTRLVDDMLDVSRIKTGHLSIKTEEFDLYDLVIEVIGQLNGQFQTALTAMPIVSRNGDLTGVWDRLRLEQVITNLLTNAIRYGNQGQILMDLSSDDRIVRIEVIDHGMGIPEDARERIFDRFERSINSHEVSGLGLGLFITRQIILAHKGKIWVESELKKGSRFIIELPKNGLPG